MPTLGVNLPDGDLRLEALARATGAVQLADSNAPAVVAPVVATTVVADSVTTESVEIRNPAGTFGSVVTAPVLTAGRTVTLPDANIDLGIKTDGRLFVGASLFSQFNNWASSLEVGGAILSRTPASSEDTIFVDLPFPSRATAGRGIRIDSVDFIYHITVANLFVDITNQLLLMTLNGTGSIPTLASVAGTFDVDHDTPAERSAIGEHTATFTPGTPAFLAGDTVHQLQIAANDTGGSTSVVDLRGAYVRYSYFWL